MWDMGEASLAFPSPPRGLLHTWACAVTEGRALCRGIMYVPRAVLPLATL